jgi:hypothetical protein
LGLSAEKLSHSGLPAREARARAASERRLRSAIATDAVLIAYSADLSVQEVNLERIL